MYRQGRMYALVANNLFRFVTFFCKYYESTFKTSENFCTAFLIAFSVYFLKEEGLSMIVIISIFRGGGCLVPYPFVTRQAEKKRFSKRKG